jgi:hypothetical protein
MMQSTHYISRRFRGVSVNRSGRKPGEAGGDRPTVAFASAASATLVVAMDRRTAGCVCRRHVDRPRHTPGSKLPPRFFGAWFHQGEIRSANHDHDWAVPGSGGAPPQAARPAAIGACGRQTLAAENGIWSGASISAEHRLHLPISEF